MPYNPFSVPMRVHKLPHTDYRVNTECSITHYNNSCSFLFHCTVFEYDKFRTHSLSKFELSTLIVPYCGLHMN